MAAPRSEISRPCPCPTRFGGGLRAFNGRRPAQQLACSRQGGDRMGLDWFGIGHKASRVSGVRLERAIVSIGCENVARSPAWCHRSGRSCVRFVPLPYSLAVRKTRFACHSVLVEWPYIAPRKPVRNAFMESLSGCVIPVSLPARNRPRLIRGAASECDTGGR